MNNSDGLRSRDTLVHLTKTGRLPGVSQQLETRQTKLAMPHAVQTPSFMRILDEVSFLNVLRIERKRIERSGQHLVLMLLDLENLKTKAEREQVIDILSNNLLPSTRETDYKGWYEQDAVLGIMFVDIHDATTESVQHALLQKVDHATRAQLSADGTRRVKISLHVLPEPRDGHGSDSSSNLHFYRDSVLDHTRDHPYHLIKRLLDVLASALSLIALFPIFLLIALAIKLTSKGPILFRQERLGQNFSRFTLLKFRSMYVDNDDAIHKDYVSQFIAGNSDTQTDGISRVFKLTQDPRITPLGHFLRRTSLDELPQLINVLQGHMTLVGPRPCTTYEFACYKLWHRQRILSVKPGITGLWQVTGRSSVDFDQMVRLDLAYVKTRSLWLDFTIIMKTPRVVLSGRGAC